MFEPLVAALITRGTQLLTGVRGRWIGCGPSVAQRIYFANHTSHMDFLLLWSALSAKLRAKTRPVAAEDYWSRGVIRRYVGKRVFRGVFVERAWSDRTVSPIVPMIEALDRGDSLILFPEGTRGAGTNLLPFKSGIFHVARERPGVDLVPVWTDNSYRVMPRGAVLPIPFLCRVTFGAPLRIQANEDRDVFLDRLRLHLLELKAE
jgi:1-acyl-sn-glycerol-3-phosphate acyltransferase